MIFKVLPVYVTKNFLINFIAILLMLLVLVFCWNLVVMIAHANTNQTLNLFLGCLLKVLARTHQVLPFAFIAAGFNVLCLMKKSQQLISMKILGYNFWNSLLPGLLALAFLAGSIALLEQKYRPDIMLQAYAKFCQAGQTKYCAATTEFWETSDNYAIYVQAQKQQIVAARMVSFEPKTVKWYENVKFRDGSWYSGKQVLPIKLQPGFLKYGALAPKDRPAPVCLDLYLVLAIMAVLLLALYLWQGRESNNM